jgi:hypothetical protein
VGCAVSKRVAEVEGVKVDAAGRRRALASASAHPDRPILVPFDYKGATDAESIDLARDLRPQLGIVDDEEGHAAGGRVGLHLVGQGGLWAAFQEQADADLRKAELRGFPIIALILLVAFGSLAATTLPLPLAWRPSSSLGAPSSRCRSAFRCRSWSRTSRR